MTKFLKFITWVTRIFQLAWSLVILGVTAYMADEFRKSGQNILAEIFVPLLFVSTLKYSAFRGRNGVGKGDGGRSEVARSVDKALITQLAVMRVPESATLRPVARRCRG